MPSLIADHPYFFANLLTLAGVHLAGYLFLQRAHRRLIILSGLVNLTCFPFLVFLEGEYWQPVRFGGWIIGIEDALCSYDVAALLWLLLSFRTDISPSLKIDWRRLYTRFMLLGVMISLVFLSGCFLGLRGMTSLLVTQLVILPVLYFLKPGTWTLALKGLILYLPVYFLIVRCYFLIWPDFIQQWNLEGPWGPLLLGLPLGEFAWAAGFTLWWPPFFTFLADLNLQSTGRCRWVLGNAEKFRAE